MNSNHVDQELQARFHELRDEVVLATPAFETARVAGKRRAARRWILVPAATALVAAVLVWVIASRDGGPTAPGVDLSVIAWTAATDFLLETPGSSLLTTVPYPSAGSVTQGSGGIERGAADTSS